MTGFGVWRCADLLPTTGGCAALIFLAPLIAALPSISDGEDTLAFRLTVLAVPIVAVIVVLAWQFGLPLWSQSRRQANHE